MSELVFHTIKSSDVLAPESGTVSVTAGETPTNKIVFGITFNLNDTLVPIKTDDLANIKANGIELTLPSAVTIGSIADFTTWFNKQFNVTLPAPAEFPPPLNNIFGKISSLVWTVNTAHVKVQPAGATDPNLYTLFITAEWIGEGIPLIPGVLSIQGAVFGVTNEAAQQA